MSLENYNFSAFSQVIRLDISIMYSLMFSLPLYRIETSLPRMVLISTFSNLANRFAIWLRKLLVLSSLGITPQMVSGIVLHNHKTYAVRMLPLFKVSHLFYSTVISKGGRLFRLDHIVQIASITINRQQTKGVMILTTCAANGNPCS